MNTNPIENRQVAVSPSRASITETMASKYGMSPAPFEATVRAMCSPPGKALTREEFATFLLTANKYNLNPLMREIYALPKKGGGIVPTVSIDGWMHLANAHPAFDGLEFESEFDQDGTLVSTTCILHRKDRAHPTRLTELFSECFRDTDPWKAMPNRMLRHKAAIQATRYAFSFAGIYDEDEAARFAQEVQPAITSLRANHVRAEEYPQDEINAPEAPKLDVSELTTDEAAGRLKDMLDERAAASSALELALPKDEGVAWVESIKAEADVKAQKGFKIFSQWANKLSKSEAKLLAPYMDSYRAKATYADKGQESA
jgi:phage recombination protein Bet